MNEEASQRRRMRINRQPSEALKNTVLFQQMRSFDPANAQTDRINQGQELFRYDLAGIA